MRFRNTDLIKSYIKRVLTTGYGTYNFVKDFKGYGVPCDCSINTKSRKKRIENLYRKLEKRIKKEERLSFPKPKKRVSSKMLHGID